MPQPELTIEYVREHGQIVLHDEKSALVEVKRRLLVSYVRVTLDEAGKIQGFVPYLINKYVRVTTCAPQ